MLPAAHRLTDGESFRRAVRAGRRAGSSTVVVHLQLGPAPDLEPDSGTIAPQPGPRVGFVVSRAVGNAVTRNRVQRRLRHLTREHLATLPGSSVLVVRALPAAAAATSAELRDDLDRCLQRVAP